MPKISHPPTAPTPELLRLPEVLTLTGIRSQSQIDGMIKRGDFPKKIQIGPRSIAWRAADIRAWIDSRPEK